MFELEEAEAYVVLIEKLAEEKDSEGAHTHEDKFHLCVLKAIAEGQVKPQDITEICALAASTEHIEFSRWRS